MRVSMKKAVVMDVIVPVATVMLIMLMERGT